MNERTSVKCDCCNGFLYENEAELVTIKIRKHPGCEIEQMFVKDMLTISGREIKKEPLDLPRTELPNPIAMEMERIKQANKDLNG